MAVAAVAVSGASGIVGWVLTIGAAYVDATYTYPALLGKGRENARSPRLLGVPVGSNEAGAPRVWAIGGRVRVPTHVLWQTQKVREAVAATNKAGTNAQLRRVFINALIGLNDRRTNSLQQLVGNGKLLLYKSRNVVNVTTSQMSAAFAASPDRVGIFMASTLEPNLPDVFDVGDIVKCSGFVYVSGPNTLNGTYWQVLAVGGHSPGLPSSMSLVPVDGQTIAGMAYQGGSPFTPARIERVDDAIVSDLQTSPPGAPSRVLAIGSIRILELDFLGSTLNTDAFLPGHLVRARNLRWTSGPLTGQLFDESAIWTVLQIDPTGICRFELLSGGTIPGSTSLLARASATELPAIDFVDPPLFTRGIFQDTFVPSLHYGNGNEFQGESSLLAADKGTGNIPAYRGVAVQGLDSFFATQFGDQLPYALEALIDPDSAMTWPQAVAEVLERAGIPASAIDVSGIDARPFAGMFLRGAVPTATAIQPLLMAGQLVGQERDGVISVYEVDNCDVVQVENGAQYSDLATRVEQGQRDDSGIVVEDQDVRDLPTSLGVRHQDPDNQYADGYQHFGLRNPAGVDHQNEQEVDLSNMVLSRKQARELTTTLLRRAWVNRRTYRMVLPSAYLDILENDVLTLTDDQGTDIRVRVIQRDAGNDWLVGIVAINEDIDLAVTGSPVQTAAGQAYPSVIPPAYLRTIPIDAPAVANDFIGTPGIQLAVCAEGGGANWSGASIYESVNGATYQLVGNVGSQVAIATLDTDLTAQAASEAYGTTAVTIRSQTVDVTFAYEGDVAIESATLAEASAGKNWVALLGPGSDVEIAAFTTVTPNGARSYTLGGWLRGLRGTSPVIRPAGVQLALLEPQASNVWQREFSGAILPTAVAYKVVPFGAGLDDVPELLVVAATWRNARPLPVRAIQKTIFASPFDARLEVLAHWERSVLPLGTQPPHQMDEPVEAYRFDIYDPTGLILRRQKTLSAAGSGSITLRDKWVTYTAAEQTADGYTPGAIETFWVDVLQIGQFGISPSIRQEI